MGGVSALPSVGFQHAEASRYPPLGDHLEGGCTHALRPAIDVG